MQHLGDGADVATRDGPHPQPLELVVVELVGIVDGRQVGGVDDEQAAPQRIGGVAAADAVEPDQQPAAVLAHRLDHEGPLGLVTRPGAQRRTRREAAEGIVGADVDDDLAGDAVRLDDPSDYEVH